LKIDKNLNLKKLQDRAEFDKQLENEKDLPFRQEIIKRSIDFMASNLRDDEWLKIYPVPSLRGEVSVSVKIVCTKSCAVL
jgi:hypothetical protein